MFRPKTSSSNSPRDTLVSPSTTTLGSNMGTSKTSKLRSHASNLGFSSTTQLSSYAASTTTGSNGTVHPLLHAASHSGSIPSTLADSLPLPRLVVFDLDYTLWPFWVDTHVAPPLKAAEGGRRVRDSYGEAFALYDDVGNVLAALRMAGVRVAAASRTHAPELAREMLKLLRVPSKPVDLGAAGSRSGGTMSNASTTTVGVISGGAGGGKEGGGSSGSMVKALEMFGELQIFPGSKMRHFEKIREATGVPFEEMLFFDDESRNREVEQLGVVMWLVRDGVSNDEIDKGVLSWRKRNRRDLR